MFLDALTPAFRQRLFAAGRRRHLKPGAVIYRAGSEGDSMLLVETGRAEVSFHNQDGRKTTLNHVGPGELLGEFAVFDGGLRSADVIAVDDITALELRNTDVKNTLLSDPEAMLALLQEVSRKARDSIRSVERLSHKSAATRLAQCILQLGDKWGEVQDDRTLIGADFSQGDIGDIAGLARENVNRLLRSWAKSDIVKLVDGQLHILDRPALREIAGL